MPDAALAAGLAAGSPNLATFDPEVGGDVQVVAKNWRDDIAWLGCISPVGDRRSWGGEKMSAHWTERQEGAQEALRARGARETINSA